MAKEWAIKFYKSSVWKKCRESYISTVFGLCEECTRECTREGKEVSGYIVHHKISLTPSNINDVDITLSHDNLEYLCLECHNKEHGICASGDVLREGLMFNIYGELVEKL